MSNVVSSVGKHQSVRAVGGPGSPAASAPGASAALLPEPSSGPGAVKGDIMAMLYALTAKERDTSSTQRAASAQRKGVERQQAFEQMREEIQKAKDAEEDGGWLGSVTKVLDGAADALVGGNPLQDIANSVADATGVDAVTIAYDFIRPDAILHAGVLLASAASGEDKIAQGYDMVAGGSSLKTRFQGAADASGKQEAVMMAYEITRDAIATAMVTVGTCGTGTAAYVAVGASALLMAEQRLDLLGQAGVSSDATMGLRLGAQIATVVVTVGAAYLTSTAATAGGKATVAIVNGANQAARGGVQLGQAHYDHESSLHLAESAKYESAQHRADREQQRIITGLRAVAQSYQRSLENIASALSERDQTSLLLAQRIA